MLLEHYKAATEHAAVADLDLFGLIKITGADRVSWLQGMLTNDVAKLSAGRGCYAAHLTPQGKLVAQMHVIKDEDVIWLELERAAVPKLMESFDRLLIMEDAQVADVSSEYAIIGLFGPHAAEVLESWAGAPMNLDSVYVHRKWNGARVLASPLGIEVWIPRSDADGVLRFIAAKGATPIDHGAWDVLRTEAGIPVWAVDLDETTTLPELGEAGISYDKGCYIGQEVVAKVKYLGHVNRRFTGLLLAAGELPEPKTPIRKGGRDAGYITTALFSPGLNRPIALGFVNRFAYAIGGEVEVGAGSAKIVDLPFIPQLRSSA